MTTRDPLEPSNLILPFYQDGSTVPFAAANLYCRGYASHLALARTRPSRLQELGLVPPSYQAWRGVLMAEKVPQEAIVESGSQIKNSRELGLARLAFLGNGRKSRVIVVASAPWSRLRNLFRRLLPIVAALPEGVTTGIKSGLSKNLERVFFCPESLHWG